MDDSLSVALSGIFSNSAGVFKKSVYVAGVATSSDVVIIL